VTILIFQFNLAFGDQHNHNALKDSGVNFNHHDLQASKAPLENQAQGI